MDEEQKTISDLANISQPISEIWKLNLLDKWERASWQLQEVMRRQYMKASPGKFGDLFKSRTHTLYIAIRPTIKRSQQTTYEELEKLINPLNGLDKFIKAFEIITEFLDKIHLFKFDTKKPFDHMRPEEEEEAKQ